MLWKFWSYVASGCEGKGEGGEGGEGEGKEYDNLAVYNEALLATMGDYLRNDILL